MSTFIRDNGDFPYGFFYGLFGMIGLCLLTWTMYAKHQQALAVTNCIESEIHSQTSGVSDSKTVQSTQSRAQSAQSTERSAEITPEDQFNRASSICEMKCIRGNLSGCQ
ncbi:MAG: hypothetical protein EAZ61_04325 [Oscillatoriales cyanobacterium]|nr:MAG: hypothetical protein EAZ61_04325 [Oscillatoriales cyanobacterium]